jgi:hypothetical protein
MIGGGGRGSLTISPAGWRLSAGMPSQILLATTTPTLGGTVGTAWNKNFSGGGTK